MSNPLASYIWRWNFGSWRRFLRAMQRITSSLVNTSFFEASCCQLRPNSSRVLTALTLLKKILIPAFVYCRTSENDDWSQQERSRLVNFGKFFRDLVRDMRRGVSAHEQFSNLRVKEESSLHPLSCSMKEFTESLFTNPLRVIWRVARDLVLRKKSERWWSVFSLESLEGTKIRSSLVRCVELGIFWGTEEDGHHLVLDE